MYVACCTAINASALCVQIMRTHIITSSHRPRTQQPRRATRLTITFLIVCHGVYKRKAMFMMMMMTWKASSVYGRYDDGRARAHSGRACVLLYIISKCISGAIVFRVRRAVRLVCV